MEGPELAVQQGGDQDDFLAAAGGRDGIEHDGGGSVHSEGSVGVDASEIFAGVDGKHLAKHASGRAFDYQTIAG